MANTTHCALSAATVIEGIPIVKWMNPASTYKPGAFVYPSATATATYKDKDTAASLLFHWMVVEFKPSVASTNARTSADSAYAATDQVPVVCGTRGGSAMVVGIWTDQNAAKYAGHHCIAGDDGAATVSATANIMTGLRLAEDIADDDTYAKFWLSP